MIRDDEEKRETKEEGGNNIKWTTGAGGFRGKTAAQRDESDVCIIFTFEVLEVLESIERAGVAVGIVDAEGREELEDLFLDGGVGRVEGRGQFGHILAVLDDVVEPDARIHDAAYRVGALDLQPRPVDGLTAVVVHLALIQLMPTCVKKQPTKDRY